MVNEPTVQAPPERVDGKQHRSRMGLTIDVSIKDTEVFSEFLCVVSKIVMDQRMPAGLRDDAMVWLNDIGASAGTVVYAGQPKEYIVVLCESVSLGNYYWQQIQHKYNPNATIRFIGQSLLDGLSPDKVVLLKGYEKSRGIHMTWFTRNGEKPQVIDESGECS